MVRRQQVTVLGGGGFIGAHVTQRLVADGHLVRIVGTTEPDGYRARLTAGAEVWVADLTDRNQTARSIAGSDVVYHFAADMGGAGYFHSDADLGAAITNGTITANVFAAVSDQHIGRTFYASSACAYPIELQQTLGRPMRLNEELVGRGTPDALYGAEKLHGLRLAAKVPGARVGIIHTVYGPGQEHTGRRAKFPPSVARKAIAARTSGVLELWGDGWQERSYLFIDDAVEKIIRVMSTDGYWGPVNIGAQGALSCREVAQLCLRLAGAEEAQIVTNPAEPSGVLARDCSNTRFNDRYGAVEQTSYEDGFDRLVGWIESTDAPTTATRTPPRNASLPPLRR